jgi:hypothetical protein
MLNHTMRPEETVVWIIIEVYARLLEIFNKVVIDYW